MLAYLLTSLCFLGLFGLVYWIWQLIDRYLPRDRDGEKTTASIEDRRDRKPATQADIDGLSLSIDKLADAIHPKKREETLQQVLERFAETYKDSQGYIDATTYTRLYGVVRGMLTAAREERLDREEGVSTIDMSLGYLSKDENAFGKGEKA